MRVTTSMYYKNLYAQNNKTANQLFDVNKQISSGQKIQYAYEGTDTFIGTMRLDNEVVTFEQIIKSTESGLKFSTQTDSTIGEFTKTLDAFKVKLIQAASDVHSDASMQAIANELEGLRNHLVSLSNTAINGNYLFSGSAVDTKPINDDGSYNGNDGEIQANLGSNVRQTFNISGAELFLGEESKTNRKVTLNVPLYNQSELYPDIMKDISIDRSQAQELFVTANDTIRDLMGDNDAEFDPVNDKNYFFVQGMRTDGIVINEKIEISVGSKVEDLLDAIGIAFGNTMSSEVVDVELNEHGQIEVTDKLDGSSKMQFHMVGFLDDPNTLAAGDIEGLMASGTPVKAFMESGMEPGRTAERVVSYQDPVYQSSVQFPTTLHASDGSLAALTSSLTDVFEDSTFTQVLLGGLDADGNGVGPVQVAVSTVEDLLTEIENRYDRDGNIATSDGTIKAELIKGKIVVTDLQSNQAQMVIDITAQDLLGSPVTAFSADSFMAFGGTELAIEGNELFTNIAQIVRTTNEYATSTTKLIDVAGIDANRVSVLDGSTLSLHGYNVLGNEVNAEISFDNAGSTFTLDGGLTTYGILDPSGNPTPADEMTYQQLMDVVSMIMSNTLPSDTITVDGSIDLDEYNSAVVDAKYKVEAGLDKQGQLTIRDRYNSQTLMQLNMTSDNNALLFNANNALTIRDPKTDFFARIDEMIGAVRENKMRADATYGDPRNGGVQNSIQMLDDLLDHVSKQQAKSGSQSNALQVAMDRTEMLKISAITLRSNVLDTDIAEASLRLQQLSLNMQAMLSTVGKVSQLSLVNYL